MGGLAVCRKMCTSYESSFKTLFNSKVINLEELDTLDDELDDNNY